MWGNCKYTRNENKAFEIAHKWASSLPICEYGVNVITYNKTWKHIVEDAKKYAEKEIDFINKQGTDEKNEWYKCQLERLQKIINGEYS